MYVYICMCAHIYPSHPPEEVGEVEKVREDKGAGLKKRRHLPGEDHHCPLHPFHHSFKANTLTSLS